jgi:hypothetical protein
MVEEEADMMSMLEGGTKVVAAAVATKEVEEDMTTVVDTVAGEVATKVVVAAVVTMTAVEVRFPCFAKPFDVIFIRCEFYGKDEHW